MNIKNINRAKEIATDLPKLEGARKLLSQTDDDIRLWISNGKDTVTLPGDINANILNVINLAINQLKKEVEAL